MTSPRGSPVTVGHPTLQKRGTEVSPPQHYIFNKHFRFVLSHKSLPFETVWVEYPDIAPKLKEIGASPGKRPNGEELYSVPVLSDPNTGALITDSWVIAEYLDKTYPEKPVFPNCSKGLINAFHSALRSLAEPSYGFVLLRVSQILNERSQEYFIPTREALLGCQVDEWSSEGPKRDAHWAVIENSFYGTLKTWYEKGEGKWLMGDTFSYADILCAVYSLWFKRACWKEEWEGVASLHDGKWEKLLTDVERECNLA